MLSYQPGEGEGGAWGGAPPFSAKGRSSLK